MDPGCKVSISDLEMGGWINMHSSPTGTELEAECRRPCQPRSRVLYQLPDHFKDPREDGSTLSTQSIYASTFNAACLEVPHEAAAATVPATAHPHTDNARYLAQQPCLTFPHASRHHVCPACSTMAELLIHKRLNDIQGTEELAQKVAYTHRRVEAMERQVLLLLEQQQDAAQPVCQRFLAEVSAQQGHHLEKVNQILDQVGVLAESFQQLNQWQ